MIEHECKDIPSIQVEISGYCNLRCKMCHYPNQKRKKGFMSDFIFNKILNGCKKLKIQQLSLFVFGDPLLHPKLSDFLAKMKLNNIVPFITTNGLAMTEELMDSFIENNVKKIVFSIDGANKEEYESIRIGSNYEQVIANLLCLRDKINNSGKNIQLTVQTMVMNETIDNIQDIINFCKRQQINLRISHVQTMGGTVEDLGTDTKSCNLCKPAKNCNMAHYKLIIYWNGETGFCCSDGEAVTAFDSLQNKELHQIWKGKAHQQIVNKFYKGTVEFCRNCPLYFFYKKIVNGDYHLINSKFIKKILKEYGDSIKQRNKSWENILFKNKHKGKEFVVGCTGPSAENIDLKKLCKNRIVIGVNNFPKFYIPDYLFLGDKNSHCYFHYFETNPKLKPIIGQYVKNQDLLEQDYPIIEYSRKPDEKIGFSPNKFFIGREAGIGAVNIALKMGAKKIYIVGMDGLIRDKLKYAFDDKTIVNYNSENSLPATKCLALIKNWANKHGCELFLVNGENSIHNSVLPTIKQKHIKDV